MSFASSPQTYQLYTDGACDGNPGGPGGWAAILVDENGGRWFAGPEPRTTNQRMEIMAAIKGLQQVPPGSQVSVFSDSQYLVNTMTKNWQRKANLDLWAQLDPLVKSRRVAWEWVRGHSGHPLNEQTDKLAVEAKKNPAWGERSGDLAGGLETSEPFQAGDMGARPRRGELPVEIAAESVMETASPPTIAPPMSSLSHVDAEGHARMVDVSPKDDTERVAIAEGRVVMEVATLDLILQNAIAKGDVLAVAQIAGIMAAKRASDLIPMCHPLMITHISVDLTPDPVRSAIAITATVKTTGKTGVEMEALTAVSVAALAIYDMAKAVDRAMRIEGIRLLHKSGGKSGEYAADDSEP